MARAFLVEVARKLGREEADCSFIKKLVLEEWLDSVADLQQLTAETWETFRVEYRIPVKFVHAVRDAFEKKPPGISKSTIGTSGNLPEVSPLASATPASFSGVSVIPNARPQQKSWAFVPRYMDKGFQYFCNPKASDSGMLSAALQRLLLTDSNVLTYGLLGKTVLHSSLSDAAAFAKAAWIGKSDLNQDLLPRDLFKDLNMLEAIEPPHAPIGECYGTALVIGDCSLEELRSRLRLAARLKHQGVLGDRVSLQVCVGVEINSTNAQIPEHAKSDMVLEVKSAVNEILGPDSARVLSVRCVAAPGEAANIFRAWLRVAPDAQPSNALLLISSQPYALWHQLIFERILQKHKKWSMQWPPELVHVAASEAPVDLPCVSALDAIGRILVEMDAKLTTTNKKVRAAVSRL